MNRRCPDRHYQLSRFKHWAYHQGWVCHLCCRYSLSYLWLGVKGEHYKQCHADWLWLGGEIYDR